MRKPCHELTKEFQSLRMPKHHIIWSNDSLVVLDKIIDYVYEEWGIQPVLKLEHEIIVLVKALSKNKKLCPKSKILDIRKCVLMEQVSLIYKIESSHLEIITFIDNRSEHSY